MSSVSFEYARSLFELASSKDEMIELKENLETSLLIFKDDTYKFFMHPEIDKGTKKEIISKSFPDSLFKNFIYVLIDNDRLSLLEEIKDEYNILLLNKLKTTKVFVYSKEMLSKEYMLILKDKLTKKIGNEIEIENIIDESIVGGIKVKYDSKEIDLTVNTKMKSLISNLKESL